MGRKLGLLAVCLALGMVACGPAFPEDALEGLPTLAPTGLPPEAPEPAGGDVLNAGRLAYAGSDGNIYVLEAGTDEAQAITDDASLFEGVIYDAPTWSRGGWLSYVRQEFASGEPPRRVIYAIQPGEMDAPRELYETDTGVYEYGYWAPAACDVGPDCGRFAFLIADSNAHQLHMAQLSSGDEAVEERTLGEGAPFYYSWAPDGERMLWFRQGATLEVVDVNDVDASTVLPDEPGLFQSPWWSPVDERLLFSLAGEEGNALVVAEGDERRDLTGEEGALSAFAWAPDGRHLAHVEGYAPNAYPFSSLRVLADDGDDEVVLTEDDLVIAFFWSPDSQQIAYVTVAETPDGIEQASSGRVAGHASPARQDLLLAWNVADVSSGDSRELVRFTPTPNELYLFQFFDQFAQSHSVWSPDSSQIVYTEVLPGGMEGVNVIDVEAADASPVLVSAGSWAVFSFDQG